MASSQALFLQKGVDLTTVEEIAAGATVSKGAFYLHFASKADLIEALRAQFIADLLEATTREVLPAMAWSDRLSAWSKGCAAHYLKSADLHRLIFASAPVPSQEGMTRNMLIDNLAGLLASGSKEGAWRLEDPHFTAIFLFNALHGAINIPTADGEDSRRHLLSRIADHFLRTVGANVSGT